MFIGQVEWNDDAILDQLTDQVVREIGSDNGILVIDTTTFSKKGRRSVGVERQWCGRYGKSKIVKSPLVSPLWEAKNSFWSTAVCTCRKVGPTIRNVAASQVFPKNESLRKPGMNKPRK